MSRVFESRQSCSCRRAAVRQRPVISVWTMCTLSSMQRRSSTVECGASPGASQCISKFIHIYIKSVRSQFEPFGKNINVHVM